MEFSGTDLTTIIITAVFLVILCILIIRSIMQYGADTLAAITSMTVCIFFVIFCNMSGVEFDLSALMGLAMMALSIFYCVSFLRARKKK